MNLETYDKLYQGVLKPLAFQMDPEKVHYTAMNLMQRFGGPLSGILEADPVELFGVRFPNRLGLAAGFDKNGVGIDFWHQFGFGHVELGTVTFHAQPGNPKPRLFRLATDKALINRMGFNNDGAAALAERLKVAKPKIPIGINLGKSKITPLEEAAEDYASSYKLLHTFGDYFVINVSSPNTPGLRSLQDRSALESIVDAMRAVNATRPLFVKIAPDLEFEAVDEVIGMTLDKGLTGLIATNTTLSRAGLQTPPNASGEYETGGLSGAPLTKRADEVLGYVAQHVSGKMTLIGVGGVGDRETYLRKRDLGADIVQLYTGWIYGGPVLVPKILNG